MSNPLHPLTVPARQHDGRCTLRQAVQGLRHHWQGIHRHGCRPYLQQGAARWPSAAASVQPSIATQVKPKGARKITFEQFLEALRQIATRKVPDELLLFTAETLTRLSKDLELAHVEDLVLASPGPMTQATQPDYVKFHDDKVCCSTCCFQQQRTPHTQHTFTGMYAKRGG